MVVDHDFAVFSGRVALGVEVKVVGHIRDKLERTIPGFHGGVFEVVFLGNVFYGFSFFLKYHLSEKVTVGRFMGGFGFLWGLLVAGLGGDRHEQDENGKKEKQFGLGVHGIKNKSCYGLELIFFCFWKSQT